MRTRLIIVALGVLVLYFYNIHILYPVSWGYEAFTEYAANLINKNHRLPAIRNAFPLSRFIVVQWLVYLTAIIIVLLFSLTFYVSSSVQVYANRFIGRLRESLISVVETIKSTDKLAIGIFFCTVLYIVLQSVWYMLRIPFIHDEAYTITNFIIPGPTAAVTFYPYPNNHILFSLISYPFSFLPIQPEIAFRLPSLLAIILTSILLFILLLKFLQPRIAALGVLVFVCLLPVMAYAIFARGYSMIFLFSTFSIYFLLRIVEENSKYHRALLIAFSVLGLYTLPSYLYSMAAVYIVYFVYGISKSSRSICMQAIVCGGSSGLFTFILYLPVIITSGGWQSFLKVIYHSYETSVSIAKYPDFIREVYALQFFEKPFLAVVFLIFVLLAALLSIKTFRNRKVELIDKIFFWVCIIGFFTPLLSFLIQRKLVAPRTHNYAALFFAGLAFISIKHAVPGKWKNFLFVALTLSVISLNIAYAHKSIVLKGEEYHDETGDLFAQEMLRQTPSNDTCYSFHLGYFANIQLRYALQKRELTVYQFEAGSPSSTTFRYGSKYPWVLTSESEFVVDTDSMQLNYKPVIIRYNATLWKRKNE